MKLKIKEMMLSALIGLSPFTAQGEIFEINSTDGLVSYFDHIDDTHTLVIFDIHMVLLITQGSYFRIPTLKKYHTLYKNMTKDLLPAEEDMLLMYILMDSPLIPLDEKMITLVQSLKAKGMPTIAFTSSLTGSLNRIDNIANWQIYALEYVGFDFHRSPSLRNIIFSEQFARYLGSYPMFNKGVLFTNGSHGPASKGSVLVQFLQHLSVMGEHDFSLPDHIMVVDDRKENLTDMEASLKAVYPRITFIGIHFTAANNVAVENISEEQFQTKMKEIIGEIKMNQNRIDH